MVQGPMADHLWDGLTEALVVLGVSPLGGGAGRHGEEVTGAEAYRSRNHSPRHAPCSAHFSLAGLGWQVTRETPAGQTGALSCLADPHKSRD